MTKETLRLSVQRQSDTDLLHALKALNADLDAHMASGQPSTQAHIGMVELAQAAADELAA